MSTSVEGVYQVLTNWIYKIRDGKLNRYTPVKSLKKEYYFFKEAFACSFEDFEEAVNRMIEESKK